MEVNQEQIVLSYSKRQDNTFNRDETIQKYLEKEIPKGKSTLCRFYLRGCCLFPSQDCKFAHGIEDLNFVRLDLEEFEKNQNLKNNTEESCTATEEVEQPSLMLEMTYKSLYEYQFILQQKKEISKTFTQSEINQDKETRYFLRDMLLRDIYQDFLNMLFAEYNTRALRRAFIGQCLLSIGLKFVWKFIFVKDSVYEVKSQSNNGTLIVKQLAGDLFDTFMEDCIIKIINDKDLLSEAPISPAVITRWYYQYLAKQDPFLPPLHVYLNSRKIKTIDEYLDRLQNSETFITKLALQCKRTLEEMNSMILFNNSSSEMSELIASIKSILPEVIEESEIGFVLYSVFENRVMEKCAKKLQQFNNNLPQLKKLMAKMILDHNIHIMSFDCNPYLFSPAKFEKVSLSQVHPKFTEGLHTGCSIEETDHLAEHNLPNLNASKMNIFVPERQSEEFLAAELDMEKVVLVDSEDTLKVAIEHFATVDTVSVDLEGALCKGGRLELIQCASRTKVFVFDVYRLATMAREGNNNDMTLYSRTVAFLKNMMEDSKICKVFHDGRQDSVAIHVFLNACVSNVFDTSAVHLLLEYLEKYSKKKNGAKVIHEEEKTNANVNFVLNVVEEVKLPGLNEVLEKYEASNGPNRLKYIMRSRFSKLPVEYFLSRPIDKEFLIYSARDVEDLIEVKERMEEKLNEAIKVFIKDLDSRMMTLLWKFVSKIYCRNGCEHNE